MIFALSLLLSACAACHTCEDPLFERITSTTIIENKKVGFSGLLVILENYIRDLAEKQGNMTSSMNIKMNITNIADYAVSVKRRNNGTTLLHADSCNMTYYNNYTNSSHSTSPNTPHYHLFHSHTLSLSESPSGAGVLGKSGSCCWLGVSASSSISVFVCTAALTCFRCGSDGLAYAAGLRRLLGNCMAWSACAESLPLLRLSSIRSSC